eukprot:CAMPEP_0172598510 /NCGR_PEP_ID=MMETSP1068-20121228/18545_1 /TAXON_ID=35684 /ORGANISM="Pseudopedinella elastica, Strain CCMP716" /LENGTH=171 /DNA_ID=CAMNT_0013398397 /DNA_START=1 /DNA_END=516 /DNA_ORIENTATION=+
MKLLWFFLFATKFVTSAGFSLCSPRSSRRTIGLLAKNPRKSEVTPAQSSRRSNSGPSYSGYNDDAFGFVFLTGGALARDEVFAATFVVLSGIAATLTAAGKLEAGDRAPAAVAAATFVATPALATVLSKLGVFTSVNTVEDARLIELGVCLVSILYGLWRSSQKNERASST